MKTDIAKRWVAALRNPEATQTYGSLGTATGARCCLGVLCDLAVADGVIPAPRVMHGTVLEYDGVMAVLPPAVGGWAGMKTANGSLMRIADNKIQYDFCLAEENDAGKTFEVIAGLIEVHAEDL